jgi:hypothetical protein
VTNDEDGDTDEADDENDEADAEDVRARLGERQAADLVEAAHALFGSREVAQADYERSLRDRIHEVSFSCIGSSFVVGSCR